MFFHSLNLPRRLASSRGLINAAIAMAGVVMAVSAPQIARADQVGYPVAHTTKPFTDTIRAMKQRDNLKPRPPKYIIFSPPEHDEDGQMAKITDPQGLQGVFTPPGSGPGSVGRRGIMALGTGFPGITLQDEFTLFSGGAIPPDTTGVIGPNHYVETINGCVAIYNRAGTRLSAVSLDSFFAVPAASFPTSGTTDPRLVYDRRSGRWFACIIDLANTSNRCGLAVSKTSDPTGAWDKFVFNIGDGTHFGDYESLGVDDNGVYFGANEFPNAGNATPRVFATPKASLLAASPTLSTVTAFNPASMFATPQPATNFDAVPGTGRAFFVASSTTVFGNVNYLSVTWSGSTPSFSGTSVLTTPAYGNPPAPSTSGTTSTIDIGDDRLMMAIIRNGRLWTARNVGVNSNGGGSSVDRCGCEWMEIDATAATLTLVQSGRVFDPGSAPRSYFYPSVCVSGQGHATIAFSGTKSTEFVGAYFCQRLKTDNTGTMGAVGTIKSGVASYQLLDGNNRNRWGDYSYTSLDPADDMTLWTIQEFATAHPSGFNGGWGTWITRTTAPAPTLNNPNGTGSQGQTGVTVNLTGTGFFDPGAGFTNRLTVQLTGGATNGISNVVTTFNNPTSASVKFDIASNASVGTRDIKLTNPDGQSVTVTGGFSVTAGGATSVLTASDVTGSVGATVNLTATLTDGTSGLSGKSITFKVDGVEVAGSPATTNASGVASVPFVLAEGTVGAHAIAASFAGDGTFPAASDTSTLTVNKSTTTADVPDLSAVPGKTITLSATLTRDTDGGSLSGKTISFTVGANSAGTATTNASGVATKSYTVPSTDQVGPQTISASFAADANYQSTTGNGTLNVVAPTTLTVTNASGGFGLVVNLKSTLKTLGVAVPNKSITFLVDGSSVGSAMTNTSGVATLAHKLTESLGTHTLKTTFAGDTSFAAATSGNGTLTVNKATPTLSVSNITAKFGSNATLRATLKSGTNILSGETLTFKLDGVTLGTAVTDATGLAKVLHKTLDPVGSHTITVEFAGDSNYNAVSKNGTLTVTQGTTKITADVLKKPAGSTVTYGAKLVRTTDSTALPGETLDFFDTATNTLLGSGTTDANGRATISVTAPGVGVVKSITVKFAGDGTNAASTGTGSITGT